jgi:hypothetical protein
LAVLTKGPVAWLIAFLVLLVYWARFKFGARGYGRHLFYFSLAAGTASVLWFLADILLHGPWFIQEFITYQIRLFSTPDAGHAGFWGYHVIVLLLGCFPISVFALPNLWGDREAEEEALEAHTLQSCMRSDFGTWMQILFWVVLILFSLVKTKIVHYSSLAYFPITYLGATTMWRAIRWQVRPRYTSVLLPMVGVLLGLVVMVLPWLGTHIEMLRPLFTRDPFALANLEATVDWRWWHALPGVVILTAALAAWYFWKAGRAEMAAQTVLAGGAVFTSFSLLFLAKNIEGYTQGAAIEFYEKHSRENSYVQPVGYKTYAHLFYTDKQPPSASLPPVQYDTLAHGHPQQPVYFVARVNRLGDLPTLPDCRELYRKNGFVFYQRIVADSAH